jgi:hypothetical protein
MMDGVYPQRYRVQLWLHEVAERDRSLGRPVPPDVDIHGGDNALDDIVLGTGPGVVKGVVRQPDGSAYPDLPVLCYPVLAPRDGTAPHGLTSVVAEARTDARGEFALVGLPATRVMVAVAPYGYYGFNQFIAGEQNLLAAPIPQIDLDLARDPQVALAPITPIANDTYTHTGRVALGPRTAQASVADVVAMLAVGEMGARGEPFEIPLGDDGTFEWRFGAPGHEALTVFFAVRGTVVHESPIVPLPGQQRYEVFQLP